MSRRVHSWVLFFQRRCEVTSILTRLPFVYFIYFVYCLFCFISSLIFRFFSGTNLRFFFFVFSTGFVLFGIFNLYLFVCVLFLFYFLSVIMSSQQNKNCSRGHVKVVAKVCPPGTIM